MFGYIRPAKQELKLKEFTRYKSIYCGLCKEIKRMYGNIPRLALTYDMTFFAMLGISLAENDGKMLMESCFLNPLKKKLILSEHKFLTDAAAISMLLAHGKISDDIKDTKSKSRINVKSAKSLLFKKYYLKAKIRYKVFDDIINKDLMQLYETENKDTGEDPKYEECSDIFGNLLSDIFGIAFSETFQNDKNEIILNDALKKLGFYLGKWIYVLDAVDDYKADTENTEFNPFFPLDEFNMKTYGKEILIMCEDRMDKIAALLPYKRDGAIISNIILIGMPQTREKVFNGERPGKV